MVDITPMKRLTLLMKVLIKLKHYIMEPTELFEVMYYYYLTPKDLLMIKRFNRTAQLLIEQIICNIRSQLLLRRWSVL